MVRLKREANTNYGQIHAKSSRYVEFTVLYIIPNAHPLRIASQPGLLLWLPFHCNPPSTVKLIYDCTSPEDSMLLDCLRVHMRQFGRILLGLPDLLSYNMDRQGRFTCLYASKGVSCSIHEIVPEIIGTKGTSSSQSCRIKAQNCLPCWWCGHWKTSQTVTAT